LGYEDATCGDLRGRDGDGVRVGEEGVAVTEIGEPGAQLQGFEQLLFGGNGGANEEIGHEVV
jgi:hypothetical protein